MLEWVAISSSMGSSSRPRVGPGSPTMQAGTILSEPPRTQKIGKAAKHLKSVSPLSPDLPVCRFLVKLSE